MSDLNAKISYEDVLTAKLVERGDSHVAGSRPDGTVSPGADQRALGNPGNSTAAGPRGGC